MLLLHELLEGLIFEEDDDELDEDILKLDEEDEEDSE